MKHIIRYIPVACLLAAMAACRMELQPYDQQRDRLNFIHSIDTVGGYETDQTIRYTFVYTPTDVMYDTVWVPVRTLGHVSDRDRVVSLRQGDSGEPKAVADKHYVSLDNAALTGRFYRVRAGQTTALIPVVMIRHADLQTAEYSLTLEIEANDDFGVGYPVRSSRQVYISDMLQQPLKWDFYAEYYFLGTYGKVKHQFMIDCVRDRDMVIDDKWIESVMNIYDPDMALLSYWGGYFTDRIIELNARRKAELKDVLREADDTPVRFSILGDMQPYE